MKIYYTLIELFNLKIVLIFIEDIIVIIAMNVFRAHDYLCLNITNIVKILIISTFV